MFSLTEYLFNGLEGLSESDLQSSMTSACYKSLAKILTDLGGTAASGPATIAGGLGPDISLVTFLASESVR